MSTTEKQPIHQGLFGKSALLMSSTFVANIVALVGYALLTKIYSMDLVGQYFSIIALSTIASVFVHFGLLQAVPLMGDDDLRIGVTVLSSISLILVASGFAVFLLNSYLSFVLLAAGVLSARALIEGVLVRAANVNQIAVFRMLTPLVSFSFVLAIGLNVVGSFPLIVGGYIAGLSIIVLFYYIAVVLPLIVVVKAADVKQLLQKFSKFPRFIGPGLLFHTAAYNIPSIVGLHFFGGATIAAYNLAYKFVLAPMTIIGTAIGQAYIGKLSHAYRSDQPVSAGFRLDSILIGFGLISSLAIYLIFPLVASIIFPEDYENISSYAIALIPIAFSMLAVSPLSHVLQFTENQKKIFLMHVVSFVGSVFSFGLAIYVDSFMRGVVCFSLFILARYIWLYVEIVRVREF